MTKNRVSDEFWVRADEFIAVANKQSQSEVAGKVGASMLYAASRFAAFDVASKSESAGDMAANKQDAMNFYVEQFKKMLDENMDDYVEHFDSYTAND